MLIKCPECTTTYNLDASKITPEGSKVRCSRCKHIFTVVGPEPKVQDQPQPVATPPESAPDSMDAFEKEFASFFNEHKKPPKAAVDQDMLADLEGAFQQPLIEKQESSSSSQADRQQNQKKSVWSMLLLTIVLVVALALGLVYYLKPSLLGIKLQPPASSLTAQGDIQEGVANIGLENVRQYFVPNEKEGQLFIIEGQAINRFEEPRELIRLKASLFNQQGSEVTTQEFMCGNVVSLYQLQVASRQDIEAALTAKVGILTNNTNIQPGASVPFMVIFFDAPETVEEFGLEVIQASVPAQ